MAQASKDLFLNVGANIDPLTAAMKVAKTVVNEYGGSVVATTEQVSAAFQAMMDKPGAAAKAIEASATRSLRVVQANAEAAIAANSNAGALEVLNAAATRQAADAATAKASALRVTADAAMRAAEATTEDAAASRAFAAGAQAAAVAAEHHAEVMQAQARVLGRVEGQLHATGERAVELAEAHTRMGASGMIAEHVIRSMSDSIAAGQSPMRALMMEMGRITEATTMWAAQSGQTEGVVGKLAKFMGGPWGIAVSAGVAVMGPLIASLVSGGEAAEDEGAKLRKNAEDAHLADVAKAAFARTQEGLIAATRELTKELDKQNESLRTNAERQNIRARETLASLQGKRAGDVQELADAQAARQAALVDSGTHDNGGALAAANTRVATAQAALDSLDAGIKAASVDYQRSHVDLAAEQAKRDADPVQRINHLYDERIRLARVAADEAAREGRQIGAATTAKLAGIEAERKAALKAEQERKAAETRAEKDGEQSGRKVTLSQAEDIVRGIGGRITSTTRTTAQQQTLYDRYMAFKAGTGPWAPLAAKPGTSEHERGQAIDIAKGGGMSLARIVEAFRAQGVRLTERLDEGDHFHVAWGGKGKAGPSDETLAKRRQAAEDKGTRDAEAYAQLMSRAQEETLKLQRDQVISRSNAAQLDVAAVEAERRRLDSAAQAGAAERKWSQAQADALIAQNAINAGLKTEAIQRAAMSQTIQAMFADSQDARDARDALLQIDADMADTRKQRLAIERRLLADRQQSRYEGYDRIAQDPNSSPEDVDKARRAMAELPAQNAAEQRQLDNRYQSPLAGYRDELTRNVGDMGDALQGVEVNGVKGLENGLLGLVSGTKTAAQAFREMADQMIADIARIAIEKAILSVIGLKDGGLVQRFAGGGAVFGAGGPRDDRVPAMLSHGEFVINAQAYAQHPQLVQAINSGALRAFADGGLVAPENIYMRSLPNAASIALRGGGSPITFDLRGAVVTADLLQQMNAISARHAMGAVIASTEQAKQDRTDHAMSQIP